MLPPSDEALPLGAVRVEKGHFMRYRALVIPAVAASAVVLSAGPATAHTVGVPGTPSCFGERMSHGSSVHKLTPKERAAGLQEIVDSGLPEAVAFFGPTVSVGEMTLFVRINCSDDPIIPEPPQG